MLRENGVPTFLQGEQGYADPCPPEPSPKQSWWQQGWGRRGPGSWSSEERPVLSHQGSGGFQEAGEPHCFLICSSAALPQ